MSTPTITNKTDTEYLRRMAAASVYGIPDESERRKIVAAAEEIDKLRDLLAGPCGSCHPCMNWSGEVLRRELLAVHEGIPTMQCPRCGDVRADRDGFGMLYCHACGWCDHPSVTGDVCDACGGDA